MPEINELETLKQDWTQWPNLIGHPPSLDDFQFLDNGLTNNNWLLKGDDKSYVIRMNAANAQALYLNREAEWHIHQVVSEHGLCPGFVYRHPKDKYWIRPFEHGQTLNHAIALNGDQFLFDFLPHAACIYRQIHNAKTSSSWPRIHFKTHTDHYWQQLLESATQQKNELAQLKEQLDEQFQVKPFSAVLCHMDGNANNWIVKKDQSPRGLKISLIDWEYSAVANPMWDLAVFIDHLQLSQEQETLFLNEYGPVSQKALKEAKDQMQYLSQLWYVIQNQAGPESLKRFLKTETS